LRKLRRDRGHYLHFYRPAYVLARRPIWLERRPNAGMEAIRCLVYADRYHRYTGLSKPVQKPSCAGPRLTERTGYAQVTFGKEANYRANVGKATKAAQRFSALEGHVASNRERHHAPGVGHPAKKDVAQSKVALTAEKGQAQLSEHQPIYGWIRVRPALPNQPANQHAGPADPKAGPLPMVDCQADWAGLRYVLQAFSGPASGQRTNKGCRVGGE